MKTTIGLYVLFALVLSACHAETPFHGQASLSPSSEPSAEQAAVPLAPLKDVATPAYLANLPNMACKQRHPGWGLECTSGDFRITAEPDGCVAHSSHGKVKFDGSPSVELWDRFRGEPRSVVAKLKDQQFACIVANARHGNLDPEWLYITVIPVQSVKACAGNPLCEKPGDLPVKWMQQLPTGQPCHLNRKQQYAGDCASGWVRASNFAEFTMGL